MIPILILAAGQSSRMNGTDKLMLDVNGQPLLERQIQMASQVGPVFVALSPDFHARIHLVGRTDASSIMIPHATEGIGATLREAVAQLPKCDRFLILLADLISLLANDLRDVMKASDQFKNCLVWRGATPDGLGGHPIIFDTSLRPDFAKLTGDQGADRIANLKPELVHLHRFEDDRARYDLDTPEQWAAWRKLRRQDT